MKKRESKSRMEGSHSPFGFIWQIATATGWSMEYILWKVPYATLLLMLSDAPHMVDEQKKAPATPGKNARRAANIIDQLTQHEQSRKSTNPPQ